MVTTVPRGGIKMPPKEMIHGFVSDFLKMLVQRKN